MTGAIKIKLGCDPEFVRKHANGEIVEVSFEVMEHFPGLGSLGSDHGGRVHELHPVPCYTARGLTNRLAKLIVQIADLENPKAAKWRAGALAQENFDGGRLTLGGHVHFGVEVLAAQQRIALDSWNKLLLALDILPRRENNLRMAGGLYGLPDNAVRVSYHHGDKRHIEYRAFPSWLHHPAVTQLTLAGARIAMYQPEAMARIAAPASFAALKNVFTAFKDSNDMRRISEKLVEPATNVSYLQKDIDADMRDTWRNWKGL